MTDYSKETYPNQNTKLSRRKVLQISSIGIAGAMLGCSPKSATPNEQPGNVEQRLADLGIVLPLASKAVAAYSPYKVVGNMVYIAGQGPSLSANAPILGKVGTDITIEEGKHAARLACINLLAQAKAACGGDLDRIVQWVKMGGFVNSAPDFTQHPNVINGATELLRDVFGANGLPARFAVGASSLPFNVCVEIDASFEFKV